MAVSVTAFAGVICSGLSGLSVATDLPLLEQCARAARGSAHRLELRRTGVRTRVVSQGVCAGPPGGRALRVHRPMRNPVVRATSTHIVFWGVDIRRLKIDRICILPGRCVRLATIARQSAGRRCGRRCADRCADGSIRQLDQSERDDVPSAANERAVDRLAAPRREEARCPT